MANRATPEKMVLLHQLLHMSFLWSQFQLLYYHVQFSAFEPKERQILPLQ